MKTICIALNIYGGHDPGSTLHFNAMRLSDFIEFNYKQANIMTVYTDYMYQQVKIILTHPEFDPVPPGCACEMYTKQEARQKFPFLFVDVNPLIWRRFKLWLRT